MRMFYGTPSSYMWEDAEGVEHTIWQGEGGEQGDALMPLLCSLGQHTALAEAQDELEEDRSYLPIWTIFMWQFLGQTELAQCTYLFRNICSRVLGSASTVARHRCGTVQEWEQQHAMFLSASHKLPTPDARVWRGSGKTDLPPFQQGITVLGTPLGYPSFV